MIGDSKEHSDAVDNHNASSRMIDTLRALGIISDMKAWELQARHYTYWCSF